MIGEIFLSRNSFQSRIIIDTPHKYPKIFELISGGTEKNEGGVSRKVHVKLVTASTFCPWL
jgi:hypothetical protein